MDTTKKQNLLAFVISLLIALYVWGYVTNLRNPIQTKTLNDIPIEIVNGEGLETQNLSINSNSISKVTVVVQGRFSELQSFDSSQVSAKIDLQDLALKEGKNAVLVDVESTNNLVHIVKEKTTMKVELDIEKIVQKEIPVIVQLIGNPASDFIALEPTIAKEKIIVSGSKNDIEDLKHIVAMIDVSSATEDVTSNVKLKALNKYGEESKNVILKDKELEVIVPIKFTKTLPVEVSISDTLPSNYELVSSQVRNNKVTVYGDKSILDGISSLKTEIIDLSRRYSDFDKLATINFPEGVSPVNKDNSSVYVSFVIEKK